MTIFDLESDWSLSLLAVQEVVVEWLSEQRWDLKPRVGAAREEVLSCPKKSVWPGDLLAAHKQADGSFIDFSVFHVKL